MNIIIITLCGAAYLYWLTALIHLQRRWRREDAASRHAAVIRRIIGPWG
jgi:threonine/homoserine/homoserine lactone efflux protein